jgi:hypothetical protein
MTNVVIIMQSLLAEVIKPLWDRFAVKQSGANAFIAQNIELFAELSPSANESFVISRGKMAATPIETFTADHSSLEAQVTWNDDSGEGFKLATDQAFVVLLGQNNQGVIGVSTAAYRSEASVAVPITGEVTVGQVISAYLAFRRADGTIVSDTSFNETDVVA